MKSNLLKKQSLLRKAMFLPLVLMSVLFLSSCKEDVPASISGTVTNDESQPVDGAEVRIEGGTFFRTASDGRFSFVKIGAGNYNITVTHPDYKEAKQSVALDKSDATVNFKLETQKYTFSGKVVSASGNGIEGVTVKSSGIEKKTGSNGDYTFDDLKKGVISIAFSKDGYKGKTVENVNIPYSGTLSTELEQYVSTLTGVVTNSRNGQPLSGVTVSNGAGETKTTNSSGVYTFDNLKLDNQTRKTYSITGKRTGYYDYQGEATVDITQTTNTHNFTMKPSTTTLAGRVTDRTTGAALSGVSVSLNPGGTTSTGSDGRYTFENLSQTSYSISATRSGYSSYSGTLTVNLDIETNTYEFTMEAVPEPTLTGTVTDASTGAAISGATVSLNTGASTTTNANGVYSFNSGLTTTSYTLTASKSGYNSNSISTGTLSSGSNTRNIALTLAQAPTKTLSGTVTNSSGNTLSGVVVRLGSLSYTTSSGGTYSFTGLTESTYTLSATLSGYNAYSATVSLPQTVNTFNFQMTAPNSTQCLPVYVDYNMSLATSAYIVTTFGAGVTQYKEALWATSSLPSSDDAIRAQVMNGTVYNISNNETSYANLSENTSYTYCAVGYNSSGAGSCVLKYQFTTKSTSNQPRVAITIPSVTSDKIYFTTTKNSYCSGYSFVAFGDNSSTLNDIVPAFVAYYLKSTSYETTNYGSGYYFNKNTTSSYTYVVALGYNSSGVNSGYVDVKVVNNSTNSVVRSASIVVPRSTLDEIVRMQSSAIDKKAILTKAFESNK